MAMATAVENSRDLLEGSIARAGGLTHQWLELVKAGELVPCQRERTQLDEAGLLQRLEAVGEAVIRELEPLKLRESGEALKRVQPARVEREQPQVREAVEADDTSRLACVQYKLGHLIRSARADLRRDGCLQAHLLGGFPYNPTAWHATMN
eukprot:6193311-Pleurochrysis_carterae.AAC.2